MRSLRVVALFIVVMAVAAVADAQCLRCYREPGGPISSGKCGQSSDGYCDRSCCGNMEGAPCRRPDFLDPCGWLVKSKPDTDAPSVPRAAATHRQEAPYFATRRPLESRTEALYRRMQKCGART
jgi:hypothetical protein